jgi:phenylacetate-CoA ligase
MNYIKLLLQLYHLKRNIAMTRKDMIVLQQKKLRKILKYAYYHSEYYHKTFTKAGITAKNINRIPLSKFPKINKTTLIQNFDNIITQKDLSQQELIDFDNTKNKYKKTFKKKYHIVHSSGSTGKPAYFVYDNKAWESMLIGVIRAALWNMSMPQILKYLFKKPRILYIAATDGRYDGAMAVGDGIEGVKGNQLFIDINMPLKK